MFRTSYIKQWLSGLNGNTAILAFEHVGTRAAKRVTIDKENTTIVEAKVRPKTLEKFQRNVRKRFLPKRADEILRRFSDQRDLEQMPVHEFMDLFAL